ncbi:MAG: hypothetical protein IPJ74_06610 [Saprospiraceae bacterium]|nr:hypothetical protein [Saprospiraceae bacterium]
MTSLYIGLKVLMLSNYQENGGMTTKKTYQQDTFYLNLSNPLPDENERQMTFDFQFLTKQEFERKKCKWDIWFKANDILKFEKTNDLDSFIEESGWLSKTFTKNTIRQLRKVILKKN